MSPFKRIISVCFTAFLFVAFSLPLFAQIASITPAGAGPDQAVTLTFDATLGNKELMGASKVYVHHGVVTDKANGTAWKYVKGNWGKDDGVGLMTKVPGQANKWQITFTPSLRAYFGVPAGENVFRIACVFRSADGSKKGTIASGEYGWGTVTSNSDIFVNLNVENYVTIKSPTGAEGFLNPGQSLSIQGEASASVTDMKIWLNEGTGYTQKAAVTTGKTISYTYTPTKSVELGIRITATINGKNVETSQAFNILVRQPVTVQALPAGLKQGVNYDAADPTRATLVFLAPFKEYVFAVGDFTGWKIRDEYQMNRTPDGQFYWLELKNLVPGKDYVYQYWIDGKIKVGDPYARQVADPWNDKFIESSVFPGLPLYQREDFGIASVLKTNQTPYVWADSENTWKRPDINHLVVYELHIRDFIASHSYNDLIDTLSYLKRLGVDAIELMPLNEFEGNDSWGYNPSYFFALDKYYGTADKLKKFIETAHQQGMAVILDIVLNHAFGQSPMVQMYFDGAAGKPAANNPWFNREYVGQYQWGYDFNHESSYTKKFIDDVNRYWLQEFHFDGFRFDFTKGFTNYAPGGSVDGFDQSRINILKRMADEIRKTDPNAYIILEHWGPANEEAQLGTMGMKMWRNRSYDYVPAAVGTNTGSFTGSDALTHITYFNSHDERRIGEHCLAEGRSSNGYNIRDSIIMFERVKMAAAFKYLHPGPKMIWQFDELGYDIDINFNGRTGRKPQVWGPGSLKYYNSTLRQHIYDVYKGVFNLRTTLDPEKLRLAQKNHQLTGEVRRLAYKTSDISVVVLGNFGIASQSIDPKFWDTGVWYDYFSGDSIVVANKNTPFPLAPGQWHIYTSKRISSGIEGAVAVYGNPVTITPAIFSGADQIKIRFDARKASPGGTAGLRGANKVYMHAGVNLGTGSQSSLVNIVGNLTDDGVGKMVEVSEDIWEITLVPNQYFGITQGQEIFRIGMWFRNEDNTRKGFGFRDAIIYADVQSDQPIVTINPPVFNASTEVTITFNARAGNRELAGADNVYMHSGVGLSAQSPQTTAWTKVVGNWGQDDGVGKMTRVSGQTDMWMITLKPSTYYSLANGDFPYWIAAVFRNGNGAIKGTTTPGNYDFGIVANNFDFFLKNYGTSSTGENEADPGDVLAFPNPSAGMLSFRGISGTYRCTLTSMDGKILVDREMNNFGELDVSALENGMYLYVLRQNGQLYRGKWMLCKP